MRVLLAAVSLLIVGAGHDAAQAQYDPRRPYDPYPWCAEYGHRGGGGTNCYFKTLEQCRWSISGRGGFCRPNPFYTGPERRPPRKPRR